MNSQEEPTKTDVEKLLMSHKLSDHKLLEDKIMSIRETINEHGSKLLALEKDLAQFKIHLDKISYNQEKTQEHLHEIKENFPLILKDQFDKFSESMDQKFVTCRTLQNAHHNETYLKTPPGLPGIIFKIILAIVASWGTYEGVLKLFW